MFDPLPVHANQITAFKTFGSAMSACAKFCRFDFFIHSAAALFFGFWVIKLSAAMAGRTALYGVKSAVSWKISIGIAEASSWFMGAIPSSNSMVRIMLTVL